MSEGSAVLAGIVVYHPDEAHLARLVAAVAPDVREVAVYANSPVGAALAERLAQAAGDTPVAVLAQAGNRGLGEAYNAFAARAEAQGDAFVFLLDQDSLPAPGAVPALAGIFRQLAAAGERPALVGAQPVDAEGTPLPVAAAPAAAGAPARRARFAYSSGSLVGCAAARSVGPFRADFFIDAIDVEWGLRAADRGHSVWIAPGVPMRHDLGRGVIRLPFGLTLTDQPPRRLYTFIRNQLAMLRLAHVPPAHKARTLALMPARLAVYLVHNRFSREVRRAIGLGLADGLRHRLGPPDRLLPPSPAAPPGGR
ncbi:MAG: glycosyltransferase [Methylobacterium sp.]|uniref:glycosyltransferase n=1 Tax=Methylobacterium sp. TaxID=409 RepID=UPI002586F24D|nr:glycosyltransferase [Methylobacterium sp.]MBY0296526.1 glycosyltransferase [Methylobacterium sp.]